MTYPKAFQPTSFEASAFDQQILSIPKCVVRFRKWTGAPVKETFGGKPIVDYNGQPLFAELAIMKTFQDDGWQTRWVETYGKKTPICLLDWKDDKYANQIHEPFEDATITELLAAIAHVNNDRYAGCWDVVSKKGEQILFAESKRTKKDSVRQSQQTWLAAALRLGLKEENFLMVEWDFLP